MGEIRSKRCEGVGITWSALFGPKPSRAWLIDRSNALGTMTRVKISDDHLLDRLSRAEDGHRLPAPHRHLSMRNRQAPTHPAATLFLPPAPPGQHSTVPKIRAGWCCRGSFGARQQTLPQPVRRALSRDQPGSTVRRCGGPGADGL